MRGYLAQLYFGFALRALPRARSFVYDRHRPTAWARGVDFRAWRNVRRKFAAVGEWIIRECRGDRLRLRCVHVQELRRAPHLFVLDEPEHAARLAVRQAQRPG